MLKSIIIVTLAVQNLANVESAWHRDFDYQASDRGTVSAELSDAWAAPEIKGHRYLLMQPADGDEVYVRFVETRPVDGYGAMRTHGWNAIEILVRDPDTLAEALADSAFEIIGPPKDLWAAPDAPRAMQALGPAGEVVYLTRNSNFSINLTVDRVFIMVLGGPSMDVMRRFWTDRLGVPVGDATPFRINVISAAQGLPDDTTYPLAVGTISDDFLIELDEYPPEIPARPVPAGSIPPGIASVSFEADTLDAFDVDWRAAPRAIDAPPYDGRRMAVTVGPAGEWIEIIETPPAGD